ncbi:conserved membrane hypothetical protein [Gammaproteobacteria bacterium]
MFYSLFIFPIESILTIIYAILNNIFLVDGISIIGLSFAVTMLSLPLYNRAEQWQNIERNIQKRFKKKLDDIRAVFHGDERYMIIRTFYRQNHYHPIYALRSVLGLAIQIPFFIASYHYLGHHGGLTEKSFYFIQNLGKPDELLRIGTLTINVLPFVMTAINVLATWVYSDKLEHREKVQLWIMALLFLVLLYTSPAGMVLYWTMNNIFSLVKNIIYKTSNPVLAFKKTMLWFSFLVFVYTLLPWFSVSIQWLGYETVVPTADHILWMNLIFGVVFIFQLLLPFLFKIVKKIHKFLVAFDENKTAKNNIFYFSCMTLFVICGLVIPSSLISTSPQEFSELLADGESPVIFINNTLLQSYGIFLFYPLAIFYLFGNETKFYLTLFMLSSSLFAIINFYIFPGSHGNINIMLDFDYPELLIPAKMVVAANLSLLLTTVVLTILLLRKKHYKFFQYSFSIFLLAAITVAIHNIIKINQSHNEYTKSLVNNKKTIEVGENGILPVFTLSKNKKNVIIVMLDRAINAYFGEILNYYPKIKESMNGFVYYPNTASYSGHTLMGAPPLYGGYEYTPQALNQRAEIPLVKKHNEALLVMPRIFSNAGYTTMCTDMSYANYQWTPDNSIFAAYGIGSALLAGTYTNQWIKLHQDRLPAWLNVGVKDKQKSFLEKKLFSFSLFRIMPVMTRPFIYDDGAWLDKTFFYEKRMQWFFTNIIPHYSVLDLLPQLCRYDGKKESFMILVNDTTHNPAYTNGSDFISTIRNEGNYRNDYVLPFDDEDSLSHFFANLTAIKALCAWFDKLKEENVYENSKIIIVSDHGYQVTVPGFQSFSNDTAMNRNYAFYNPLLLVKDFDASGDIKISDDFMTNADVPSIAVSHLPHDKRVNPFTNNTLDVNSKANGINIVASHKWQISDHGEYIFNFNESDIVHVKDNIFVKENWSGTVSAEE